MANPKGTPLAKRPGFKYEARYRQPDGDIDYDYPEELTAAEVLDAARQARAAKDLELWKDWDAHGRKPSHVKLLLDRFRPMLAERSRVYTGKDLQIPPAAIEAEFKRQFMKAIETYDPDKGSLGTHVYSTLRAASRFIATHQNIARIPETRIFNIGKLQRAQAVLDAEFDRTPSEKELAQYLKWKVSDVVRLQKDLRRDIQSSRFPMDTAVMQPSRLKYGLKLVREDLAPRDRNVFDVLMSRQRTKRKIKQIAAKMKTSPSAISRSKSRIAEKLKRYLDA